MRCAVFGCNNNNMKKRYINGQETKFFRFPKDESLSLLWKLKCKRAGNFNVKTSRICSLHFKETDYPRNLRCELLNCTPKGGRVLKDDAVPSVLIPLECSNPTNNARVKRIEKRENKIIQNILNRENKIMCRLCQKEYSDIHSKNEHMWKVHSKVPEQPKTRRIICPLCCSKLVNFPCHNSFCKHLLDVHNVDVKISNLYFKNFIEFAIWKSQENRKVNYPCLGIKTSGKGEKMISYYCIGTNCQDIVSNSTKSNPNSDSIYINEVCPSRIEIKILNTGEVLVEFVETHVGHEDKAAVNKEDGNISINLKEKRSEVTSAQLDNSLNSSIEESANRQVASTISETKHKIASAQFDNSCNSNIEESANKQHTSTILKIMHKIFEDTEHLCYMLDQHQLIEYRDFLNDKVKQLSNKTTQTAEGLRNQTEKRRKTIPSILRKSKQKGTSQFHSKL